MSQCGCWSFEISEFESDYMLLYWKYSVRQTRWTFDGIKSAGHLSLGYRLCLKVKVGIWIYFFKEILSQIYTENKTGMCPFDALAKFISKFVNQNKNQEI
jgi:hypothetical protein